MKVGQKVKFPWLGETKIGIIIDEYKVEDRKQYLVQTEKGIKYPREKNDLTKI